MKRPAAIHREISREAFLAVDIELVRRRHLRETNEAQNEYIELLIRSATLGWEAAHNHSLVRAQRELRLTGLKPEHRLPRFPLHEVTAVQYIDAGGNVETLDPANYTSDNAARPGLFRLTPDADLPEVSQAEAYPWRILYTTGYADQAAIPEQARTAIMLMVGSFYLQRETLRVGSTIEELTGWFRRANTGMAVKRFT